MLPADPARACIPVGAVGEPPDPLVIVLLLAPGQARIVGRGLGPMRVLGQVEQRLGLRDDRDAIAVIVQPFGQVGPEREHILDHRLRRDQCVQRHVAG